PAERFGERYAALVSTILERIRANRSVLVFTDSRRRAERITWLVNQEAGEQAAWAHHGSLSREIRQSVERRLAEGALPCVVATSSLELGIDIGAVDEVILAGTPGSAAQTLQRIGRSGHRVGAVSRGRVFPFHGLDLLQAAAAAGAVEDREIEETRPIDNPLDILAQVILELCTERNWKTDELYHTLRGFYSFRTLSRPAFDGVIRMLTGHYGESRIRELRNRLYLDRETGELTAAAGLRMLLYISGGVIANRGYFSLRLADGTKIGELDEEFVWERRIGDSFEFGSRSWTISGIGAEAVSVIPREEASDFAPFYRGDTPFRSPVLVRRMLELLDAYAAGGGISAGPLGDSFSADARRELAAFLAGQADAQAGVPLPGENHIPVEIIEDWDLRPDLRQVFLHSFRGGAINHPLSLALAQGLEERAGCRIDTLADDNAVLLTLPRSTGDDPEALLREALREAAARGEGLFRRRLAASGIFGAAFREAAERSLLLPRTAPGKRMPLWISRERSRRLFDATVGFDDFPVISEAWRVCLEDRFDLPGFAALLRDLAEGRVELSFFRRRAPSPFARSSLWQDTNSRIYEGDERKDAGNSAAGRVSLADRIIREALDGTAPRPPLPEQVVRDFCARLRRELPGWAPQDGTALSEWVRERVAIPLDEWEMLLPALPPELGEEVRGDPSLGGRVKTLLREGSSLAALVHRDRAPAWADHAPAFLGEWLRFQGPLSAERLGAVFGAGVAEALEALAGAGTLISGLSIKPEGEGFFCDRENLELLFRLTRKKARPQVREREAALIVPYLARRQGLLGGERNEGPDPAPGRSEVPRPWDRLRGLAEPALLWEHEIFPARLPGYDGAALDGELRRGRLLWYGAGPNRVGFAAPDELDLILPGYAPGGLPPALEELAAQGFFDIPREFYEIRDRLRMDTRQAAGFLWEGVWRGLLSADSFEPLRRGLERSSAAEAAPASRLRGRRRIPRALRARPGASGMEGRWFYLGREEEGPDILDEEGLNRDRARLLLDRWGVLTRPFLEREAGPLSWSLLLPSLRRMELAGEIVAGRFFGGINSLQFARPGIAAELEAAESGGGVYWMNAADPASPAGLDVEGLDPRLPLRLSGSRLCFRGAELAAFTRRNGRELRIFVSPEDPDMGEILGFLGRGRKERVIVETINGVSGLKSPYGEALRAAGFLPDRDRWIRYAGY
ncbi:MAG: hypothetical protein LBQ35_09470, partial [Spirochaetaceae bacterium]|nr:hypothetical protein [Spirochaetaceae bacterium]